MSICSNRSSNAAHKKNRRQKPYEKKKRDGDILVRLIKKKEIELAMRQTADGKKNIKESSTSKDRR